MTALWAALKGCTTSAVRAALIYTALTLLLTWPMGVVAHRATLPVDPDRQLFIWTLGWNVHAFVHQPLSIFDSNIFHPHDNTLAYSENLIGSGVFAAPIIWLTGNALLAYNLVSLLSCVLCALGAYVLARRLGLSAPAALLCGFIFGFSPARLFRVGQMHLTTVQWMPFALAFLHTYLDTGRARDLRIAIAFYTAQVVTSGHGAVFLTVAMAVLLVYRVALGEALELRRRVRDVGVIGVLLLLPTVLIVLPYLRVQGEMGLKRTLENWAPTPESFLASPTFLHRALVSLFTSADLSETASAHLFPGYLPILLASVAIALIWKGPSVPPRHNATVLYTVMTVFALLLACGPPFGLWPLVYWLPGFNFVRGPSRFMLLAMLGLAVLGAVGFERLSAALSGRRRAFAAVAIWGVLLAEFWAVPFQLQDYSVPAPPIDRWLAMQPKPFVVAELPVAPFERYHTTYMLHAMTHWQKTVHGYSGMRPPLHDELYAQMRSFPDETTVRRFAELGVDYVVVHQDMYAPEEWPGIVERLKHFEDRLLLKYSGTGGRVYALRRAEQP